MMNQTHTPFQIIEWSNAFEKHFSSIYQHKMQNLPIINPNIQTELAVLNEIKPGMFLGAMVTPWFINLIFKIVDPQGKDRHHEIYTANVGQPITLSFPSGSYEFIVNHHENLGYFYACALISDMHSIENHDTAIEIAKQSVQLVFDQEAKEETTRQKDIKAISLGVAKIEPTESETETTDSHTETTEYRTPKVVPIKSLDEKLETPVSRRALFGLSDKDKPHAKQNDQ